MALASRRQARDLPKNVGPANDGLSQRRLSVPKPAVPPGALAVGARRMQARKRRDFVKDAKLSQIWPPTHFDASNK
jgi:hypothetical protein